MPCLFLDLGTKMGWCVIDSKDEESIYNNKYLYHGTYDLGKGKNEKGFSDGYKYLRLTDFLEDTLDRFGIGEIYYEEVLHGGSFQSGASMSGMKAILQLFSEQKKIPIHGVHNKSIKKYLTGNGNASKIEVRDMVIDKLGLKDSEIKDDNDSDALALMLYVTDNIND